MLKFSNVERIDGTLNKELLNAYRDSKCSSNEINNTFILIEKYRRKQNPLWIELYSNLAMTINKLHKRGCSVKKLEHTFNKCERNLNRRCGDM